VIHVSFAENLVWGDGDELRALADLRRPFGPATLQRIAEFEEWAAEAARHDPPPGSSWAVERMNDGLGQCARMMPDKCGAE
jgi:hypothetical protein